MKNNLIKELNKFDTFKYDQNSNKIINLKEALETNIDECLQISNILDCNYIDYEFTENIDIKIK